MSTVLNLAVARIRLYHQTCPLQMFYQCFCNLQHRKIGRNFMTA